MGKSRGPDLPGPQASFEFAGGSDYLEPLDLDRKPVAPRKGGGPRRKHQLPRIGSRIGALTVLAYDYGHLGGIAKIQVKCDCGSAVHWVDVLQLTKPKPSEGCCHCRGNRKRVHALPEIGYRIGKLKIIDYAKDKSGRRLFVIQCDCGSEPFTLQPGGFRRRKNHCCVWCFKQLPPEQRKIPPNEWDRQPAKPRKWPTPDIGQKVGAATVLEIVYGPHGGYKKVIVQCDCGTKPRTVWWDNLQRSADGRCKRCQLEPYNLARNASSEACAIVPDKAHRNRLQGRINAVISRCTNPANQAWEHYGKRGISVHEPWLANRVAFLAYLVTLPGWDTPKLELDRRDVNGNYEPDNLRFVTKKENMDNRRTIAEMQSEINALRERLQLASGGTTEPVHRPD